MGWRILVFYPEPESGMSKSTNMVVYFDWKTIIYIYVCGKCRTQCMLAMEKSVKFTGARLYTMRKNDVMLELLFSIKQDNNATK